jgi:DNA-binding MarR family transcriptional regulator
VELESQITEIQKLYPQIYHACHAEHIRAASSEVSLSGRDSAILAHLSVDALTSPSKLAQHLKVSAPTLSEALSKLEGLGYVKIERNQDDERRQKIYLSAKGLDAMKKSSVLDSAKLSDLLSKLSQDDRKRAIEGLALLAQASLS